MIQLNDPSTDRAIAHRQAMMSLFMLSVIVAAVSIALIAVRNDQILVPMRVAQWKSQNGTLNDGRFFPSSSERILYGVLPDSNFAYGGVYFLGTSAFAVSLRTFDFPAAQQRQIYNCGMSAARHTEEFQFLKMLVEEHGILSAGGDKSLVVIELTFAAASHNPTSIQSEMDSVWKAFFGRYGLYEFDPDGQPRVTPMPAIERRLRIEDIRTHVFWSSLLQHGEYLIPPANPSAEVSREYWLSRMGPGWRAGMDAEIQQVSRMVDYLKARQVNIVGLYFPTRNWTEDFPPARRYREQMMAVMADKGVSVVDLAHECDESEFADTVHLNYVGSLKIHPFFEEIAQQHFRTSMP